MNIYEVEKLVNELFESTDNRDWNTLKKIFNNKFTLDYQSMSGQPAVEMTPTDVVTAWSGLMPGFDFTHHQIGNMVTSIKDNKAHVFCYGTATHYIAECEEKLWTVVGTYDFDIVEIDGELKVDLMKFNFKYQSGNTELIQVATDRVAQ